VIMVDQGHHVEDEGVTLFPRKEAIVQRKEISIEKIVEEEEGVPEEVVIEVPVEEETRNQRNNQLQLIENKEQCKRSDVRR
jgi:hypothetical protein